MRLDGSRIASTEPHTGCNMHSDVVTVVQSNSLMNLSENYGNGTLHLLVSPLPPFKAFESFVPNDAIETRGCRDYPTSQQRERKTLIDLAFRFPIEIIVGNPKSSCGNGQATNDAKRKQN